MGRSRSSGEDIGEPTRLEQKVGLGKVWSVLKVRPEKLIIPVRLVT